LKNNAYVNWSLNNHNLRLEWFYTSDYDDERAGNVANVPDGTEVDDHSTFNVHYNFRFNEDNTRLFASIYNFTDEDPPTVLLDLNYDPYTHNAMGIMWKVGVQHRFEGGIFQ
jgi:outer membrane receptor protein involved in Fe transport